MSDSIYSQLKEAADQALHSATPQEGMKHLAHAFTLFSKEAQRLELAYMRLHDRFQTVHAELEHVNTRLQKKLHELHTISNYLDNILKNISEGILFIDSEGIITTCNRAAEEILQVDKKKVLFTSFSSHFSDDFFGFSLKTAFSFHIAQNLTYITLPNKKEVEISTTFVQDSPKQFQGLIILIRDITKLQNLQLIASRHDRLKELGKISTTVAHEIRNPLGGIRGYASLLLRDLENFPHLQDMAKNILEGTKSLERLVSNVLQFARPIEIEPKAVDIRIFLKELVEFIQVDPSFPEKIFIELHLPQDKLIAPLDTDLMKSALLNILINASEAIEEKGSISISLLENNHLYSITISDTGKGIDEEDLHNIFSPFFTTKKRGTGLGLSETYKIIQAHFGSIDVRSEVNRGTTFTINLPLKR
ncbi:MAG: ATP-binding protein [Parachlamydiales bacterium]|nr:ATP-binding protein [Parachlamydiales bacterium]